MIPLVDLKAQYDSIKEEIDAAIQEIIETSSYIRGEALSRFEKTFAEIHGVRHAIGVGSGTDALILAAQACGFEAGDEVITVPNTWISTAFSASFAGARPVFVDIDPVTYQLDPEKLEAAITPKTRAVIPVHMFGHPAPMARILEMTAGTGIRVVEDVAQAPLAEESGRTVGTIGDVGCFSFYPSKNLGCYGDGGALLTDDDELAAAMRVLADYGQSGKFHHEVIGYNSRLDTLHAAVLEVKLTYLSEWTERRREIAGLYDDLLADLPVVRPAEAENVSAVYHLYVVQVEDRDACLAYLRERGILAQVHYPSVIHLQPCYHQLGYAAGDFPVAEAFADRTLSLPIYPEMSEADVSEVVDTLKAFFFSNSRKG